MVAPEASNAISNLTGDLGEVVWVPGQIADRQGINQTFRWELGQTLLKYLYFQFMKRRLLRTT